MKHYDIQKNWKKIEQHLSNDALNEVLCLDFNRFLDLKNNPSLKYEYGMRLFDFESTDWHLGRRGRKPAYFRIVVSMACHYLVRFNWMLATLVDPNRKWRIIQSEDHSTVWDGCDTVFDPTFFAKGISAEETFALACENDNSNKNRSNCNVKILKEENRYDD